MPTERFMPFWNIVSYGLPVPETNLYKVAMHGQGPVTTMGDPQRLVPDDQVTEQLIALSKTVLVGLSDKPVDVATCVYDNTPDRDFIIDRIGNVVVEGGTSGHGFKFAPLLGNALANLALGQPSGLDPDRFSITRPALKHPTFLHSPR